MGYRDKNAFVKDSEDLEVIATHYHVKVLNEEGDGIVTRTLTLEATRDNINSRIHRIFSDTSHADYEVLNLKAMNSKGKSLGIEKIFDVPNKKEFRVLFRNYLAKGDQITYSYQFHWKGMFPGKRPFFIMKITAQKTEFSLTLPEEWDLMFIDAVSKRWNGEPTNEKPTLKKIREHIAENTILRQYELRDIHDNLMETQIDWMWQ